MTGPFNSEGVQFAFDSTSLTWAATCPRYYKYSMIDRWTPARKSVHLWFGGLFATALEHYYKHRATGLSSNDALIEVVHEAMIASWEYKRDEEGNIMTLPNGQRIGAPFFSDNPNKTRESLIRSIVWYVDQFENDPIEVLMLDGGIPAVEYSFKIAIDNGNYFCGHLDRAVLFNGDPYLMDQKTTQQTISKNFFDQFDLNFQMTGYTFAGKALWDIPLKGVIIDAAQIAVGFSRFERGFTFRSESQLDEWYDDMMVLIEQTQQFTLAQHFPMNLTSCDKYGGCPFRQICKRPPHVRENFLRADFIQRPQWNPLESR